MIYGAVARSKKTHANIKRIINKEEVISIPGIKAVLTSKDIAGENVVPFVKNDYPCLADKNIKFIGQAIALVAADSLELARQ